VSWLGASQRDARLTGVVRVRASRKRKHRNEMKRAASSKPADMSEENIARNVPRLRALAEYLERREKRSTRK